MIYDTYDHIKVDEKSSVDVEVCLCECFARDGLQHETQYIPTEKKVAVIEACAKAGFPRVEATSYSNPAVIPQFADASDLLKKLYKAPGTYYKATCANARAVERADADRQAGFGANEISFLVSASNSHSLTNLRRTREDQFKNIREMASLAGNAFRIIGTISVAFGCPFEGRVSRESVLEDIESLARLGIRHIALGDTTGMATPQTARGLFTQAQAAFPEIIFIAHFHDSRGTGIANCVAALEAGVRYFDCALGGVGGHPSKVRYGGGVTGNVCTEDWVNLLESMGVRTGVDLDGLMHVSAMAEDILQRQLLSKVARSGVNPLAAERAFFNT
ncbi:hydroxymethylglutaryl-CoA lyase [Paralcaligenes sp. KSB-10]|uniref:hydroxymethylglutaryl-CoA lyase n=1 Tax=Paralcaligenes sp. KSB-10 TaxID=2901142 RepID=UPI001E3AA6EA|nr:hydroxymethylglutaryl-CoA lyase [Paralcaligenes sp. KSB-10]UHL64218.1 hydroxymethylglutaryl-CoA lyase [Paralcaligenes sp. KSB-10]